MARLSHLFLIVVSIITSCGGSGPPRSQLGGPPSDAVESDTETACQRTRTGGAWTQLVFMSPTWRDLALRADNRDPDAWDQIATLVDWNANHHPGSECTAEMTGNIRDSAARLRQTD